MDQKIRSNEPRIIQIYEDYMSSMYQPGIPTGSVDLDQDYLNIQHNFTQLDTSFGKDHVPFSTTLNNGYHTSVHLDPVSTTTTNPTNNYPPVQPPTTAGFGQLWSDEETDGSGTDNALYFLTGKGNNIKLTTNFLPISNNTGTTFLPGGIILKWGQFNPSSATTGTKTFAAAFPNNCFRVFLQVTNTNVQPLSNFIFYISSESTTGFNWSSNNTSFNQAVNFIAIGN